MKKRLISAVLSLAIVCGMIPMTTYAATTISTVQVSEIDVPVAGKTPDYVASYMTGCGATTGVDDSDTINGITWLDTTNGVEKELKSTSTFEYGHTYAVAVCVSATGDYQFSATDNYTSKVAGKINGNSVSKVLAISGYSAKNTVIMRYEFAVCENERVASVSVKDIEVPVAGKTPDKTATVEEADKYDVIPGNIDWYDDTDKKLMGESDTFVAGHSYSVTVWLKTTENYRFTADKGTVEVNGKVNGFYAECNVADVETENVTSITYTFGVCNPLQITQVIIKDVEEPVHGELADYNISYGGTGYKTQEKNTGYYSNGIEWYDKTTGESLMPGEGKFVGGHTYCMNIWIDPEQNYIFNNPSAIVNGKTAEVSGSKTLYVSCEFLCSGKISNIEITCAEPKVGKKPDFTKFEDLGYVSEGKVNPYKNGIAWYDNTTSSYVVSGTTTTYVCGHTYTVKITLIAKEGFEFLEGVTGKLNGQKVTVERISEGYANIEYTFTEVAHSSETEIKDVKEATCKEKGYTGDKYCKDCGIKLESGKETEKTEHKGETEIKDAKEATCKEKGYTGDKYCKDCGEKIEKGKDIDKLVHGAETVVKDAKEATCKEKGYTGDKYCKFCDEKVETGIEIPVSEHKYSEEWIVEKVATMTDDGSKYHKCLYCDAKKDETVINKVASVGLSYTKKTYTGSNIAAPILTVKDSAGNILTNNVDYTVVGLGAKRIVGVYPVTVTFTGAYSGTKTLYFAILPQAPKTVKINLSTVAGGYDDVTFTWSKSVGAQGYRVFYKRSTDKKYTLLGDTTKTTVTKKNLVDGAKYTFVVYPYRKGTDGTVYINAYKSASVYTLKTVSTPVLSKVGAKVRVKWTNINGETGYQVSRATTKTGVKIVSTYKTATGNYRYVGATKGKVFYYRVRAYKIVGNKVVYGPWSAPRAYKR